ncbi:MAG TPA: hypothetical protein VK498_11265 [Ferruginibacter sp.]|nr:hypothetical protein [Ferruginibacter sp.]
MYALKNKVQLIGNLGNAPEVKNTESGKNWFAFLLPQMKTIATPKEIRLQKLNGIPW